MRIALNHVGLLLTIYRTQSTLDFSQLHTGKNIHKIYGTKKIFQITIYKSNIVHQAFQYIGVNKTKR